MKRTKTKGILIVLAATLSATAPAGGGEPGATASGAAAPGDTLWLTVDSAVELALRQGEGAALVREDVLIAQAQENIARSYALPWIDLNATYNRNLKRPVIFFPDEDGITQSFELGGENDYALSLSLQQALWSSGRVGSGFKGARERARAAEFAGDAAAADIAVEVKRVYFDAVLARANLEIAARSVTQAERRRDDLQARYDEGVAARFDLLRAKVEVANRSPFLTQARARAGIAEDVLKRAVGLPLDQPVALGYQLQYRAFPLTREVTVQEALANRRELEAARREAEAAHHFAKAQGANDLPMLYLTGNYTWQGQTSGGLVPEGNEAAQSAAVGLALTWPVFDGLGNRNKTRQARSEAEKARLRLQQVEEGIKLEARSQWANLRAIEEELYGMDESVSLAQEALDIAEVRFRGGLSTQVEVLDADVALLQAELTRTEVLYRYEVALAEMQRVIGEGPVLNPTGDDQ